jgi:hypothetical protein
MDTTPLFTALVTTVPAVCGSRGPRIGESAPRCGQELDHSELHRGFKGSGFERETWSGPLMRDAEFAEEYRLFLLQERAALLQVTL